MKATWFLAVSRVFLILTLNLVLELYNTNFQIDQEDISLRNTMSEPSWATAVKQVYPYICTWKKKEKTHRFFQSTGEDIKAYVTVQVCMYM